jgi:hypothetical protein
MPVKNKFKFLRKRLRKHSPEGMDENGFRIDNVDSSGPHSKSDSAARQER